jgi:uncharacterized protein (TIGR01777 family)
MSTVNVTVTGASGFLGPRLTQKLLETGNALHVLGRRRGAGLPASVQFSEWASTDVVPPADALASADAVIHLAGEPVAQRWTEAVKNRIHDSRVQGTRHLVNALSIQSHRPRVLVCASAIGYYGSRADQFLTEASSAGDDFLARVCAEWEEAAQLAESLGVRVVRLRIGVVLGQGGALARLLPLFRAGIGGRLSSGYQWMSWIHIDDIVKLILFAINYSAIRGAVNATAPHPVTNDEFTRRLATALHRPAFLPVPAFALKLALGEMSEVLLASQRVLPAAAKSAGFQFQYPELHAALDNLLVTPT